jgi:hypothetical protein
MKPTANRLARALGLDGNPLRRGVDRVEAAITLGLAAIFAATAPLLAVQAGQWARHAGRDEQHAQRAWHQISAVTLQSAPLPPAAELYALEWNDAAVLASWAAPDGAARTGEILTTGGTRAGQPVRVWVNASGGLTGPPLSANQLSMRVGAAAALAPAGLAMALLGVGWLARWVLNQRRLAAWESDWALFEPQWTRHR